MNISEAAEKMNLPPSTLRYYEQIGLIPPVERKNGGVRHYTPNDLNWINFIKCMRSAGLSIEALIEYTTLFKQGDSTLQSRKELLIKENEKLIKKRLEIEESLKMLAKKIQNYDNIEQKVKKITETS